MKEAQDDPKALRDHMLHSYVSSRIGIAVIGAVLPFALCLPVLFRRHVLLPSMSEYYYSFMGDFFVGALIAVGVSLYLYKGYGTRENYALNAAGIFAVIVALCPMRLASEEGGQLRSNVHYGSAVLLFVCIGYVCMFRAEDTLSPSLVRDRDRAATLAYTYRGLGILMVILPAIAALASGHRWKLFFEAAGVLVFASYWLIKSMELKVSGADVLAAQGRLAARTTTAAEEIDEHGFQKPKHAHIGRVHVV